MFVTKDDSYLEIYYQQPAIEASFCSDDASETEGSDTEQQEEVNLDWVESLLAWAEAPLMIFYYFPLLIPSLTP